MPKREEKFRLIEELTTYKNEFQWWRIPKETPEKIIKPIKEREEKARPPPVQIDNQTHAPYNPGVHVPFDLFIEPRPIIDQDPNEKFEIKKLPIKPRCDLKGKVKLHISPGVCLDDIEDDDLHQAALKNTYMRTTDSFKFSALPVTKPPNPSNTVIINDKVKIAPKKFKFEEEEESCCCDVVNSTEKDGK